MINIHLIGNVELLDVNELRSSSIIYGTLSIAVEDYRNLTKCYADLEVFFNSVNQNHVWSLKGVFKFVYYNILRQIITNICV